MNRNSETNIFVTLSTLPACLSVFGFLVFIYRCFQFFSRFFLDFSMSTTNLTANADVDCPCWICIQPVDGYNVCSLMAVSVVASLAVASWSHCFLTGFGAFTKRVLFLLTFLACLSIFFHSCLFLLRRFIPFPPFLDAAETVSLSRCMLRRYLVMTRIFVDRSVRAGFFLFISCFVSPSASISPSSPTSFYLSLDATLSFAAANRILTTAQRKTRILCSG